MPPHAGPIALVVTLLAAGTIALALGRMPPDADRSCRPEALPATLATSSKIDASDPRKVALASTAPGRAATLGPVRRAIRSVAVAAEGGAVERDCAARTLAAWARADALTDMRTKDANLTRGRLGAEVLVAAVRLDARGAFGPADRRIVARWADRLADSTIAFFADGAGSRSRINNHRQWAGLLVGAAGRLADDADHARWAHEAVDVALCSVTPEGFLPAEMTRGARAWRYHRYALRPILALRDLGLWSDATSECADALPALIGVIADARTIEAATGTVQAGPVDEATFGPALRLDRPLSVTAGS